MSSSNERHLPKNRARRHFLGVAITAGAKIAAIGAVAISAPSTAHALGRAWWKGGGRKGGGSGSHGGGAGGSQGSDGGGGGGIGGGGSGQYPSCFLRGTAIKTPAGEVAVEDLHIGDSIETAYGAPVAVRWIGRQTFKRHGYAWPESVMPIRIARHALDTNTPHTDLYLSPNHALFLNGVLIRAKELVNGMTVAPALPDDREAIEYFHIVLDRHDAVLAEGTPVETFLVKQDNHEQFANFAEYDRLYPAAARQPMTPFAPIVGYDSGREHLKALLFLGVSRFVHVNDPIQDAYQRIAARARQLVDC